MALNLGCLHGERWVIVDDDRTRLQAVATCLRQMGAKVESCAVHAHESELARVAAFDAAGYIFSTSNVSSLALGLGSSTSHPRLRWLREVNVDWCEIFDQASAGVVTGALLRALSQQRQQDGRAFDALHAGETFPLQTLGPARVLRMAALHPERRTVCVAIEDGSTSFSATLLGESVKRFEHEGRPLQGAVLDAALGRLLRLTEGTVTLTKVASAEVEAIGSLDHFLARASMDATQPAAPSSSRQEVAFEETLLRAAGATAAKSQASRGKTLGTTNSALKSLEPAELDGIASPSIGFNNLKLAWQQRPLVWGLVGAGVLLVLVFSSLVFRGVGESASLPVVPSVTAARAADLPQQRQADNPSHQIAAVPLDGASDREKTVLQTSKTRMAPEAMVPRSSEAGEHGPNGLPLLAAEAPVLLELTEKCQRWLGDSEEPVLRNVTQAKGAWRLARKSLLKGDIESAERWLCWSASRDPHGPASADLARFYFTRDDLGSSRYWADLALVHNPSDPKLQQLLADVIHQEGDIEQARSLLLQSVSAGSDDADLPKRVARRWVRAGEKAKRAGDRHQAERLLRRAITVDPTSARAAVALAQLSLERDQAKAAAKWARRAVAIDGDQFFAHIALGDAEQALGKQSAAVQAWNVALTLNPTSKKVRQRLELQ